MTPKETHLGLLAHLSTARAHIQTSPTYGAGLRFASVVESVEAELLAAEHQGTRIVSFEFKIPFVNP